MIKRLSAIIITLGLTMFAFGSCSLGPVVRGNGNVVEQSFLLFDEDRQERFGLEITNMSLQGLNLNANIVIDESLGHQLFIATDDNILERISVNHSENTNAIVIQSSRATRLFPTQITITTGLPIISLTVGGSWAIEHSDNRVANFRANIMGSAQGNFNFGELEHLDLTITGSGRIAMQGTADTANLRISGSGRGDFTLDALNQLDLTISGSGRIALQGTADTANLRISGSGRIEAFDFAAQTAIANISGSGRAELYVAEQLTTTISGSGRIVYDGNPRISQQISGSGRITAR